MKNRDRPHPIQVYLNDDELFILDSAHILPEDIIKYLNPDKWDIYYLGYPNITPKEKIDEIKKYISNGWTYKKTEDELLLIFNELINISSNIKNTCQINDIKFIDTSNEDVITVFEDEINVKN